MLKLLSQLRRRRRLTQLSDHRDPTNPRSDVSNTAHATDHRHHELRLAASSSSRKRKQASCSYDADVSSSSSSSSCRGVDEGGDDVGRVHRRVGYVGGEEGGVGMVSREVCYVDDEGDGVSRCSREAEDLINPEGDGVSRADREAEDVIDGEVSRVDTEVEEVEGLIEEEIMKEETTSFCSGENGDSREGKALEIRKNRMEAPPDDDCCPICFGAFIVPCRGPCGHWYCGGCILQYWNYTAALQPCGCPMCSQKITKLTPEASLSWQQDAAVTEVLGNVRKYNRLFLRGPYGMILKMFELPLYIKRMFTEMMNPDRPGAHLNKLRIFAMTLGFFYSISPFDFLHIGRHNVVDLFDYSAIFLSLVLYGVGIYMRRRRLRNVRELAAIQL